MIFRNTFVLVAMAAASTAFVAPSNTIAPSRTMITSSVGKDSTMQLGATEIQTSSSNNNDKLMKEIRVQLNYKPGASNTEFAKRYKHLVGAKIKTVGEAFADFTKDLQYSVNPLYKNMVTDLVGTTHLIMVNARFERDPVWSLGMVTALDLLLKNYPEKEIAEKIVSSLYKSVGLSQADVEAEAKQMLAWAESSTRQDIESALAGEGDSVLAQVARKIKGNEFWMYSRYFGIGLIKMMECAGMEMDKDEIYPIMEDWMSKKLGRSHLTACADSDLFFKVREKLDMMETMMKEIEIREKKRMAERLEEKAEQALRAAEKEKLMQAEIDAEAQKNRERVQT